MLFHDPDAGSGEEALEREAADFVLILKFSEGKGHGDECPRDGSGPCPAVRLDDITVDPDRAFPSASRSTTARRARPIRRWISIVRPEIFPLDDSLIFLVSVARGSMEYSAVIQPFPLFRMNGGTRSSMLALQMTFVSPTVISTEPSGCLI